MPPSAYKVLKAFAEKKKRYNGSTRQQGEKKQQRKSNKGDIVVDRRGSSLDHNGFSIQLTGRSTITVLIIHGGTHPHQSTNLGKHSNGTSGTPTQRTFPCLVQNLAPCFLMSTGWKKYIKIRKSAKTKRGTGHRFQQRKPEKTQTSQNKSLDRHIVVLSTLHPVV